MLSSPEVETVDVEKVEVVGRAVSRRPGSGKSVDVCSIGLARASAATADKLSQRGAAIAVCRFLFIVMSHSPNDMRVLRFYCLV